MGAVDPLVRHVASVAPWQVVPDVAALVIPSREDPLPLVALVGSSVNPTPLVQFPPSGFSLRWYQTVLSSNEWLVSIQLSLLVAALTIPTVVVLATLAAYGLHRGRPTLA